MLCAFAPWRELLIIAALNFTQRRKDAKQFAQSILCRCRQFCLFDHLLSFKSKNLVRPLT